MCKTSIYNHENLNSQFSIFIVPYAATLLQLKYQKLKISNLTNMTDFYPQQSENQVKDMNLEARMEKEFFLHGLQRRDFNQEQQEILRSELATLQEGRCSVMSDFWTAELSPQRNYEDPDREPEPLFSSVDRVWVTEHISINGVPGVGVVRSVETEWIDLGEELSGYWEITYRLRNLRTTFTEDHVFATELEALTAMATDFRKRVITQANAMCNRMRELGVDISTQELVENIANFV